MASPAAPCATLSLADPGQEAKLMPLTALKGYNVGDKHARVWDFN